ncbi:MAG: hypothetical protein IJZ84_04525 [Lachnospiraceae bacterium]|nr:hypothetical protein [Lachnospiraceae bacterium]
MGLSAEKDMAQDGILRRKDMAVCASCRGKDKVLKYVTGTGFYEMEAKNYKT